MRAVIDTNVVVSGLFWKGPPAEVLSAWLLNKFEWVVSTSILQEYYKTLDSLRAKYPPPSTALAFLSGISRSARLVQPVNLEERVCSDPDDDKFIATAVAGHADAI